MGGSPRALASDGRRSRRRRPQSCAALRWLSMAPSPQHSTAAIHLPSSLSARCRLHRHRDGDGEGAPLGRGDRARLGRVGGLSCATVTTPYSFAARRATGASRRGLWRVLSAYRKEIDKRAFSPPWPPS